MFQEGRIKNYNADRGFGFIEVDGEKKNVFFHITDVPNRNIEPKSGERLKFLIVEDKGKNKAVNIVRLDLNKVGANNHNKQMNSGISPNRLSVNKKGKTATIIGLVIIAILTGLLFQKYQAYQQSKELRAAQLIEEQKNIVKAQRQALGDLPEVKLSEKTENALRNTPSLPIHTQQSVPVNTQFSCDGREHCSQMRSYEEAVFFLRNCPNTKMDGNNDGEPCEQQFGR